MLYYLCTDNFSNGGILVFCPLLRSVQFMGQKSLGPKKIPRNSPCIQPKLRKTNYSRFQNQQYIGIFMYRRPILCTLYGAVDFLNVLKKYIMYLQVLVICDIMSLQMMAGKKYWDVTYTLRPSTSLQMPNIELHRPGIEPGHPPIE